MLYITNEIKTSLGTIYPQDGWHVGEKFPTLVPSQVVSVRVDGDELDYILDNFSNIPFSQRRVQIWRGEFARFIAENL